MTLVPTEVPHRGGHGSQPRAISPTVRPGSSLRQPAHFLEQAGIGRVGQDQRQPTKICPHHQASLASSALSSALAHQYTSQPAPYRHQSALAQQLAHHHEPHAGFPDLPGSPLLNSSGYFPRGGDAAGGLAPKGRGPTKPAPAQAQALDFRALGHSSAEHENTQFLSSIEHAASAEQTCLQLDHSVPLCLSHCCSRGSEHEHEEQLKELTGRSRRSSSESPTGAAERQHTRSPGRGPRRGPGRGAPAEAKEVKDYRERALPDQRAERERSRPEASCGDGTRTAEKASARRKQQPRPLDLLPGRERTDRSSHPSTQRDGPGLHAREVSFQQIGGQRAARAPTSNTLQTEQTEPRRRDKDAEDAPRERTQFASGSPSRPGDQVLPGRGWRQPDHRTHDSSEHLALALRSQQSSQRSRSLDLGYLEHRSAQEQSSKRHRSQRKADRVKRLEEVDQEFVLNLNEGSGDRDGGQ